MSSNRKATYSFRFIGKILFFISLLVVTNNVLSSTSQLRFERIDVNDGLSQNLVYSIFQDRVGFMWFGTKDGLNKYDGKKFTIYRNNPFDSTTISDNSVLSIYESKNGNIWVGTENGLNRFNTSTEKFQRFFYRQHSSVCMNDNSIKTICEEANGNILVGTGSGIVKIIFQKKTNGQLNYLSNYKTEKIVLGNNARTNIHHLFFSEENRIWVASSDGLFKLESNSKERFKKYLDEEVFSLYKDRWGTVWAGTNSGVYSVVDEKLPIINKYLWLKDVSSNSFWMNFVRDITEDEDGNLWLATQGGLILFNKTTKEHHFVYHNNNLSSLSSNSIISLFKDKGGVIWVGTSGKGINKYCEYAKAFNYYPSGFNESKTQSIRSILIDKNNKMWFCADEINLYLMDRETGKIIKPNFMANNSIAISDLFEDKNENIWIVNSSYLIKYNNAKNIKTTYNFNYRTSKNNYSALLQRCFGVYNNKLWLATTNSISGFNLATNSFVNYPYPDSDNQFVEAAIMDSSNNFWIGTDKKLYRFNINNKKWKTFEHNYKDKNSISSNHIKSILLDPKLPKKYIWFGTSGAGLNKYNIENNKFTLFTTDDGLPNNVIYGILSDKENKLWLSTNNGISHFDTEKIIFQNYNIFDGLQSNEFNTYSYYKSKTGELFFGGIEGITYFNPDEIVKNPIVPKVVITDFLLFNKTVSPQKSNSPLSKSITETDKIYLSYNQNNIGFKFVSLDFTSPENNKYAYKLENFDNNWIDALDEGIANYSHLPTGEYVFRVKGSNNDGVWNEVGASVKIIIAPPYWATWWAYALYLLLLLGILFVIIQFYKKREVLKHQVQIQNIEKKSLEELNELKSQFYAGISHEFRTPLTLILGPTYQLLEEITDSNKKHQLKLIRDNGEKLTKLVNQLLDLSKSEARKMPVHFSKGDIVLFINTQVLAFKTFAESKNIKINFSSESKSIIMNFDSDIIEKIISNLLSNALKFTNEFGEIYISLNSTKDKMLIISVKDNGIGIEKSEHEKIFESFYQIKKTNTLKDVGTGIGLALVKELVVLHSGLISIESEVNVGTTFIVKLPIKTDTIPNNLQAKAENSVVIKEKNIFEEFEDNKQIILVVEDLKEMREFIVNILSSKYSVVEASNGENGILKAKEILPDLVISDIMMPIKNGLELSKILKADEKTSHIPIVLLTAKASEESKLNGLEAGADNYLTKPFNPKELKIRVKNILKLQEKIREQIKSELFVVPKGNKIKSKEKLFVDKVLEIIDKNMHESNFGVEDLASKMFISKSQLYRKVKALTDYTPVQLILNYRLKKATELIEQNYGSITEVAYEVGFNNLGYFSQTFKKEYGVSPNQYKK